MGRQIGNLRGMASALFALLSTPSFAPQNGNKEELLREARAISSDLAEIRFSDIAPPDLQAEQHAREHLESADAEERDFEVEMSDEVKQKRDLESLNMTCSRCKTVPHDAAICLMCGTTCCLQSHCCMDYENQSKGECNMHLRE